MIRLAAPPYDLAPFALIAWVPLLIVAQGCRTRHVILAGLLQGVGINAVAHLWLVRALEEQVSAPWWTALLVLAGLSAVQGTRSLLVVLAVHWAGKKRYPLWLSFPVATVVLEYWHPQLFPWSMALLVHSVPSWLQAATLGGSGAVSLWLALVNALVAEAWIRRDCRSVCAVRLAAAGAVVGAASVAGAVAIAGVDARGRSADLGRVAVVHSASDADGGKRDRVPELRRASTQLLERARHVDLVVWPETAVSAPTAAKQLPRLARDYLLRDRTRSSSAPVLSAPLLTGVAVDQAGALQNTAVLLQYPGRVLGSYAKRVLVPVGETSNLVSWLPSIAELLPVATQFVPGTNQSGLALGARTIAVSICYEDILPGEIRRTVVASQPELLVNLTSDRWFRGTDAAELHFALAKLRAVEHRMYLVRATRDGVSGVIDSAGRVPLRLNSARTEARLADIRWLSPASPYTKHGAAWIHVLSLGLLGAVVLDSTRRRQRTVRRLPGNDRPPVRRQVTV